MRQRFVALCIAVTMIVLAVVPLSASAQTSGNESFTGFLVVSGSSGSRVVLASSIRARGVFNGVGKIVELESLPGDPDNLDRDTLVFADGTINLLSTVVDFSLDVNPHSCLATFSVQQTTEIAGGTGIFSDASGTGTGMVTGHALARRTPDGSCDLNQVPLIEVDHVSGTGTLSY